MDNAQLINQDSGNTEYYTPPEIIEAARQVMGSIDTDPASSFGANKIIKAKNIFTVYDNGLFRQWLGNVWLNHPFERGKNHLWVNKLIAEYELNNTEQACCITYASTSEKWFQPLFDYPQCYLSPRTNYLTADGKIKKGVTKGSVVTYLGNNIHKFKIVFEEQLKLGRVKV